MPYQREWWSGHELYGIRPQQYRFRDPVFQEIPFIDISVTNEENNQLEYWKSLYPRRMKQIQEQIENVCEQLEYDDSPMYDEYPDRIFLRKLCSQIYDQVQMNPVQEEDVEAMSDSRPPQRGKDSWLRDIIEVLLYQEMHRRRCVRGNCRRRFY